MKIRRIFVVTAALLLMCVSSILPACDLSCGFSAFQSDCHAPRMAAAESGASDMTMTGMTMPESASDSPADQPVASSVPQDALAHAALADMSACARQSCAQAPGLVSISIHSTAAQFETISAATEFSGVDLSRIAFYDTRDDVSPPDRAIHLSLDVSLRI